MNFRRVYAVFLRQIFLLGHNFTRFTNIFLWAALDVVLWGFVAVYLDRIGKAQVSFHSIFLGAVILWNFLVRVQHGMTLAFLEDVWAHNFFNLFASPIRTSEYVLGLIATGIMTTLAGLAMMLLLAWLLFAYSIFQLGFYLLPFLGVLFVFGVALGVFTTAIVLRWGPSAEWLAWPVPFLLSPFAGIFYPVSALPEFLRPISAVLPPTYVFEGMRGVLMAGVFSSQQLFVGFVMSGAYLLLAAVFFIRTFRVVLRNGLLTRFSAESL